jgi:hypothetical protein
VGLGHGLVIELSPSIYEALKSILSITKKKRKGRKYGYKVLAILPTW